MNKIISTVLTALISLTCIQAGFNFEDNQAFAKTSYFESEKDIITRAQWGANEDYLYMANNDSAPDLIQLDPDFATTYARELKIKKTTTHDSQGRAFKWPATYPAKTSKFIIHHTETTTNLDDPKQAIRNIYKYHAVSRGWGDIGYNYIIDTDGRVYEGRYGGEGVIGGHAGPGNTGSIGIAILGSYDDDDVSEAAIESLSRLIAIKSKIHGINPEGYSSFRGKFRPNIIGHLDVMNTACPGNYIYKKLPLIASMAKTMADEDRKKHLQDYEFIDKSDVYYLELEPQETESVTIKLENIGKKTWGKETYLLVNKNSKHEGVVSFPKKEGIRLAEMKESQVKPGSAGTFTFQIEAGEKTNLIFLDLTVVVDGERKITDYKVLPVKVNAPIYTYEVTDIDYPPKVMAPGDKFEGKIKLKNTGNITWKRFGKNRVVVTLNGKTVGIMAEKETGEDDYATFKYAYTAPEAPGQYYGEFQIEYRGDGDLQKESDEHLSFTTNVNEQGLKGELVELTPDRELEQGTSYILSIKLKNTGSETWNKEDIDLILRHDNSLEVTKEQITREETKPGQELSLNITVKVKKDATPAKNKSFVIVPKINNKRFVKKWMSIHYDVTKKKTQAEERKEIKSEVYAYDADEVIVSSADLAEAEGGNIRVRISTFSAPKITSNKSFYLYDSDGDLLETFDAGDSIRLEKSAGKYVAIKNKIIAKSTKPLQLKAKSDAYLEIESFNRIAAWNPDYNDNLFRGAIEFRLENSEYMVINELPLEDYLKGLAEEPNSAEYEKIKAITVAARSYAKFYMHYAEKFPGQPYHLNDDPAVSQKYLGHGYELRAPNISKAVEDTEGEVVTYQGQLIKTPYFSSSNGKTKSAKEVWNWSAPYLTSKDDPYCAGEEQRGHGVGMSGCGAKGMAEAGSTYKEILEYYYNNSKVKQLW
jgi:hypothetical protein